MPGRCRCCGNFWDAAVELDPDARELDEGQRFPLCDPARLSSLFRGAGLDDVRTRPLVVSTRFADFDEYWQPFLGGQGPAPGYLASLPEPKRAALRANLRDRLPTEADGSFSLTARAWAVRGERGRDA
jgi:hypothetical protein